MLGSMDVIEWGKARHRRRHHPVRSMFLLSQRHALAVRRTAGWVALRQHDQRRVGGISARARCAREPGVDSGRSRGRGRVDVPGHLLHRAVGRRKRKHQGRRFCCDLRARSDRAVCDGRRKASRRRTDHCHRPGFVASGDCASVRRERDVESRPGRSGRGDQASHRWSRGGCRHRGARHAGNIRKRAAIDAPRRNAVEPGRVLRQARRAVRGVLCRSWGTRKS